MSAAVQYIFASLSDDSGTTTPESAAIRLRDDAWVAAIRGASESSASAAFEALFFAYADSLNRFARSYIIDASTAEEIVSDVLLNVWEHRTAWNPEHGAAVYLYGAVRNRAFNTHRALGQRARLAMAVLSEGRPPGLGGSTETAHDVMERDEISALVWRAIDALPEPRRQAVILRWHQGMSASEIAHILGVSQGAVYQLLNRAHALLREWLGPTLR